MLPRAPTLHVEDRLKPGKAQLPRTTPIVVHHHYILGVLMQIIPCLVAYFIVFLFAALAWRVPGITRTPHNWGLWSWRR